MPPLGLQTPIQLNFDSTGSRLPTAECCFNLLSLPMGVESRDDLFSAMDLGIMYSGTYYGVA